MLLYIECTEWRWDSALFARNTVVASLFLGDYHSTSQHAITVQIIIVALETNVIYFRMRSVSHWMRLCRTQCVHCQEESVQVFAMQCRNGWCAFFGCVVLFWPIFIKLTESKRTRPCHVLCEATKRESYFGGFHSHDTMLLQCNNDDDDNVICHCLAKKENSCEKWHSIVTRDYNFGRQ